MPTPKKAKGSAKIERLEISAPNIITHAFKIVGLSPYVQNKFSEKALKLIHETQADGDKAKGKKKREPKDFKACYEDAQYKSDKGWGGIPASAFRSAMISACRVAGVVMTKAKLSVFILADGCDMKSGTPLVKITKGKPFYHEAAVRNDNGSCDLRARPMWSEGWEAIVTVQYDADQFDLKSIGNLLMRAGLAVGIGEGRNDSKKSCGMGWGVFGLKKGAA